MVSLGSHFHKGVSVTFSSSYNKRAHASWCTNQDTANGMKPHNPMAWSHTIQWHEATQSNDTRGHLCYPWTPPSLYLIHTYHTICKPSVSYTYLIHIYYSICKPSVSYTYIILYANPLSHTHIILYANPLCHRHISYSTLCKHLGTSKQCSLYFILTYLCLGTSSIGTSCCGRVPRPSLNVSLTRSWYDQVIL